MADAGHQDGRDAFVSLRMNDGHFAFKSGCQWWCQFNGDHPEFNLAGPRTMFDYGHPQVQRRRLMQIEELCTKWDVDGIEFDWLRFPQMFKDPSGRRRLY